MSNEQWDTAGLLSAVELARGVVVAADGGSIRVGLSYGEEGDVLECDVLDSGGAGTVLEVDDEVLVWRSARPGERGVVVGRIGPRRRSRPAPPDELVFEARENLTLRCGAGSITIRADGRILISGRDLVSHARRMNRIKGGSVTIN